MAFAAHLVDPQSADDLTQETYLRAVRAAPWFAGRSHLAAGDRTPRLHGRTAGADPPPAPLVADLDPARRTAFVLTQLIGLSYDEAAHACECPVGTIRSRVARARADLVQALDSDRAVIVRSKTLRGVQAAHAGGYR